MKLTGPMQVELVGRGKLKLTPSMHVATGGEGSVYRASGTMVKLYTNPQHIKQPGMLDNLRHMTQLTHECIVAPRNLVLDSESNPIGFYMDYVEGGESLSSIFTNDYRQRTAFGDEQASYLVEEMFGVMDFAHDTTPSWWTPMNSIGPPWRETCLGARCARSTSMRGSARATSLQRFP
jgi:hypothetical protein